MAFITKARDRAEALAGDLPPTLGFRPLSPSEAADFQSVLVHPLIQEWVKTEASLPAYERRVLRKRLMDLLRRIGLLDD